MSLTASQIQIITDSYALIRREPVSYSKTFYYRLLHEHPFTRVLFPDDLSRQVEAFRQTVDALVEQIDNLPMLRPTLAALAKRHVEYGVKVQHYEIVGAVLIDSFGEILADRFTPAMRNAWEALYAATAGVMVSEAYLEK